MRLFLFFFLPLTTVAATDWTKPIAEATQASEANEQRCQELIRKIQNQIGLPTAPTGALSVFRSKKDTETATRLLGEYPGTAPEVKKLFHRLHAEAKEGDFEPVSPVTELKNCQPTVFFRLFQTLVWSANHFKIQGNARRALRATVLRYLRSETQPLTTLFSLLLAQNLLSTAAASGFFELSPADRKELEAINKEVPAIRSRIAAFTESTSQKLSSEATTQPSPQDKKYLNSILLLELASADALRPRMDAIVSHL